MQRSMDWGGDGVILFLGEKQAGDCPGQLSFTLAHLFQCCYNLAYMCLRNDIGD